MTATQEQPAEVQNSTGAELFIIVWTSNGTDWHIVNQRNGKQAIARTWEKAELLLANAMEDLRIKRHSTDGADVRIVKDITKPIKR